MIFYWLDPDCGFHDFYGFDFGLCPLHGLAYAADFTFLPPIDVPQISSQEQLFPNASPESIVKQNVAQSNPWKGWSRWMVWKKWIPKQVGGRYDSLWLSITSTQMEAGLHRCSMRNRRLTQFALPEDLGHRRWFRINTQIFPGWLVFQVRAKGRCDEVE